MIEILNRPLQLPLEGSIAFLSRAMVLMLSFVALLVSTGCNQKVYTKPRSQVVEEAASNGVSLPTPEEDAARFFEEEESQRERLLALLKDRSTGSMRDSNYRIGAGDEIELNVFDVTELNLTTKVRQSGYLTLPLIGAVYALGKTDTELHAELTERLSDYVKNPQVNLFVSQFGSQKVAVMGAVRNPGTYSLKKGANSILELLSEAGGINDKAGNIINFIPAEFSGVAVENDVEARARLSLAASDPLHQARAGGLQIYIDQVLGTTGSIPLEVPVRGGDMIIIPDAGKVTVQGEVQKTGMVELTAQTTLLGALAAAGGITSSAKYDEVEIVRSIGGDEKTHLVLDLSQIASGEIKDLRLRSGDIVIVPSHSGRRMRQDTFDSISKIINFGIGGTVSVLP
jgi:polysaccharide export outer membrane protein